MSRRSKSHFRRRLVLWGLLALLCIGLTELAVCAYADPALFQRITAPASRLFQTVRTAGAGLLDQLTPEEAPVSQLAGDPAISEAPPMEDANITEFAVRADREILTGGTVALTYYNQGEEPWASRPFGPDPISGYGCGPTALSMLVSSLTDQDIDPEEMAAWAYEHGYCAPGSGSYLSIVEGVSQAYGLSAESVPDLSPGGPQQPGAQPGRVGPGSDPCGAIPKPLFRCAALALLHPKMTSSSLCRQDAGRGLFSTKQRPDSALVKRLSPRQPPAQSLVRLKRPL